MAKKEEPRTTLRSRVAEKFSRHEDEPEEKIASPADVAKAKTESEQRTSAPEPPASVYSVGAGAPPEKQKALQATIEKDRKELKKKQKPTS